VNGGHNRLAQLSQKEEELAERLGVGEALEHAGLDRLLDLAQVGPGAEIGTLTASSAFNALR
jgi:hypothetical protein